MREDRIGHTAELGRQRRRRLPALLWCLLVTVLIGASSTSVGAQHDPPAALPLAGSTASARTLGAPSSPSQDGPHALRVVALGDSVTAGTRCDCTPFPQLYARALGSRYGVPATADNRGVPGATSADLRRDLATDDVGSAVAAADVVLVTIGANDFSDDAAAVLSRSCGDPDDLGCTRSSLDGLSRHLQALTQRIRVLRQGRATVVLVSGYWNVYEDGAVADRDYSQGGQAESDRLTDAVNQVIQTQAAAAGMTYVDLARPFKGPSGAEDPSDLLVDDGDHPNAAGHQRIASALLAAGTAPLPPP